MCQVYVYSLADIIAQKSTDQFITTHFVTPPNFIPQKQNILLHENNIPVAALKD